jgi:adhesin transport system outer membrane protein
MSVWFFRLIATTLLMASTLFGLSLKKSVIDTLNNNPIVKERLRNYRATREDLNIAESDYYPKLDFSASAGYSSAGKLYDHVRDVDYTDYETALTLTQNLFNGFGTMYKVDYEKIRVLAAAYHYVEKSNDIAFRMVSAYIDVLKTEELLEVAKENVDIVLTIYNKVEDLYKSGLTTESEVKKIRSALSLAHSSLVVAQNNLIDKKFGIKRILGRVPDIKSMKTPDLSTSVLPSSLEKAASYAIRHNPSLLVSKYNIKSAQALLKYKKKNFYPKIDLEISQRYNDSHEDTNGFDQPDDRFRARIKFSYNLFNGGADSADLQKSVSKINQEVEIQRDLKRQVIEGMELSWSAYEMLSKQLKDLREYRKYSKETLKLYEQEYDLGRRTLLDLLSAQNDLITSRKQIITAKYDYIFAKYRILDAMGTMVSTILGSDSILTKPVNLYTNKKADTKVDNLPVKLDVDDDKITDKSDLCNGSEKQSSIMPYGCKDRKKYKKIVRFDAVEFKNSKLDKDGKKRVQNIASIIKKHIDSGDKLFVTVIGHTDEPTDDANEQSIKPDIYATKLEDAFRYKLSTGDSFKLSAEYAKSVKNLLVKDGVNKGLISTSHEGGFDKGYTDATKEGRELSNRVMVTMYIKKPKPKDSDKDGVFDKSDKCKNTPIGVKVDKVGCAIDSDRDGVADYRDKCKNTPAGFKVSSDGCPVTKNLELKFQTAKYKITKNSRAKIVEFAKFLKLYPKYKVKILGYTDSAGDEISNLKLSQKRAQMVKEALVQEGINPDRITTEGMGAKNPIADNSTAKGRELNRRIEAKLFY